MTTQNAAKNPSVKLVDEAYDDIGTVAEIVESGTPQPLEFILVSATSPIQKATDESLTYLNQGQPITVAKSTPKLRIFELFFGGILRHGNIW